MIKWLKFWWEVAAAYLKRLNREYSGQVRGEID